MKIAIIGAGISGLTAAYRLQASHEITVFEAGAYAGGHAHTVDVEQQGKTYSVDTGFIVFNDWTYPNFIALLEELGVGSQATEMSFSVRDDISGLEYNGHSLNTLFAQRRNLLRPKFYRMLRDILRFNREAKNLVATVTEWGPDSQEEMTVGEFLDRGRYSREFQRYYLLPMGAAIWSCPLGVFRNFPIRFIAEFYQNHGLLNVGNRPTWRVISGGSRTYVDAITASFRDRLRLSTPVTSLRRTETAVEVNAAGHTETFDHVIFACHSDQALKLLGEDATPTETELLNQFPYSRNVAVLHTDESVLPRRRRAWASWNYRLRADPKKRVSDETKDTEAPVSVTYNMSLLQRLPSPQPFCVTLNDESSIDPAKIHGRYIYHHPIFTARRTLAQSRHAELINTNRTSFCGAYWRNGFHEDGVVSALRVVHALSSMPLQRLSRKLT